MCACVDNLTGYGAGAGGVAYVGVWGNTYNGGHYYQPAYVFTQQLGNGAPKYTAEAISHEIGHNMVSPGS